MWVRRRDGAPDRRRLRQQLPGPPGRLLPAARRRDPLVNVDRRCPAAARAAEIRLAQPIRASLPHPGSHPHQTRGCSASPGPSASPPTGFAPVCPLVGRRNRQWAANRSRGLGRCPNLSAHRLAVGVRRCHRARAYRSCTATSMPPSAPSSTCRRGSRSQPRYGYRGVCRSEIAESRAPRPGCPNRIAL